MTEAEIDEQARIIWDYMQLHEPLARSDAVFALGSVDTRVAERAAQLFLEGCGDWLIMSGGFGRMTDKVFTKPEGEVFADVARAMGVPAGKLIVENQASNTGENVTLTYRLLQAKGLCFRSFILVQKPYMERRTYATFKKQWPDPAATITVTSPQIPYEEYFDETHTRLTVINAMVGDLQRIREYPKRGFQVEQDIPMAVWAAYEKLVAAGFDKHLMA